MDITVEALVNNTLEQVWAAWVTPEHVMQWNFASEDWCCPAASVDLKEGGRFNYRMEAKDQSFGFDLEGQFDRIESLSCIEYHLDDERRVSVSFQSVSGGVQVTQTFEAEDTHTEEQQKEGWQAILNNFKTHAESLS